MTFTTNPRLNERLSFARSRSATDGRIRFVTAQAISFHLPQRRDFFAMGPKNWCVVVSGKWERQTYEGEL